MRTAIALSCLLAGAGCAHQAQVKRDALPTAVAPASTSGAPAPAAATAPTVGTCGSDLDCAAGQLCIKERCADISSGLAECRGVRVHFALDSSLLATVDETLLQRSARCLKADQALHVAIEGNADERGTEEYNLALGDRRANAVSRYLTELGVSGAQLATVSYGKENPLCEEHDEACWSQNRRAELKLANAR